jgi:hypothetical protein
VPRAFDPRDPESYLADPRTRKWVVRCLSCWRFGYRADAPERFFNRHWLERKFEPLDLDEMGRCHWCRAAVESGGPVPFGYVYGAREPESDERESYEELEGRWRAEERLGSHATIKRCEAKWEWLVQQIEVGYDALLESGKTTSTLG